MMMDFVKTSYSVEVKDVNVSNLGLSKELAEELEMELGKKERLLREQIRFLEALGDVEVSYHRDEIFLEVIGEQAERISMKIDNVICSYNNAVANLPEAYKALSELELMLA